MVVDSFTEKDIENFKKAAIELAPVIKPVTINGKKCWAFNAATGEYLIQKKVNKFIWEKQDAV